MQLDLNGLERVEKRHRCFCRISGEAFGTEIGIPDTIISAIPRSCRSEPLLNEKRVLFYCYGAFGLGHLRRCMKIASGLVGGSDRVSVLMATNASQVRAVKPLPRTRFLPLSPLIRDIFNVEPNKYVSLAAGVPVAQAFEKRAETLRSALHSFRPHLVFVDHGATGAERELMPLLEDLAAMPSHRRAKLVLGLRDIYGKADWTRRDWERLGAEQVLPVYDLILVFGDHSLTTTAQELSLPQRFPGKVEHPGYLGLPNGNGTRLKSAEMPVVLVTPGGGHDGEALLNFVMKFLENAPRPLDFRFRIVAGPFLSRRRLQALRDRGRALGPVEVMAYTTRMEKFLSQASAVVCMGGYNSLVEVISARRPALVIPRTSPSCEQVLRAQRLAGPAGLHWSMPGPAAPGEIAAFLQGVSRSNGTRPDPGVNLGGLVRAVRAIEGLHD